MLFIVRSLLLAVRCVFCVVLVGLCLLVLVVCSVAGYRCAMFIVCWVMSCVRVCASVV